MQEKLQPLIENYKTRIGESSVLSDGQRLFNYLLKKYLGNERYEKAAFEKRTGLQKNVYYKLSGSSKKRRISLLKKKHYLMWQLD